MEDYSVIINYLLKDIAGSLTKSYISNGKSVPQLDLTNYLISAVRAKKIKEYQREFVLYNGLFRNNENSTSTYIEREATITESDPNIQEDAPELEYYESLLLASADIIEIYPGNHTHFQDIIIETCELLGAPSAVRWLNALVLKYGTRKSFICNVLFTIWIVNSKSDRFYKVRTLLNSAGDKYPSVPCKRMLLNQ